MIGQEANKHVKKPNKAVPFRDSLIAVEEVERARAIYLKEYKTHQSAVAELIKLLDADERKFNTTHFREDDIFLIKFTHTSVFTTILHRYLHKLSDGFIRLYIKKFEHEKHQRRKLKLKLKLKLEMNVDSEIKMEMD